jgi:hypothetical protein
MYGNRKGEPMSEQDTRKTQLRVAERERRRREREQEQKRTWVIPAIFVALLAVLGVGLVIYGDLTNANTPGVNGPHLQVDRDRIDFGDQHFDTPVHAVFKIQNTGDGTLTLNVPQAATVVEGC